MSDKMALKIAIDLMHVPSQVRLLRSEPLPSDVQMLLRIAAAEEEAASAAVAMTGRSHHVVHQAATFFIEQILFAPESDSYRVLGASPQARASELRRNVALLLRWLHPDLDPHGERSIFIGRVTAAWNDLKTPERRATYDAMLQSSVEGKGYRRKSRWSRSGRRRGSTRRQGEGVDAIGFLRRALSILLDRPLVR
jgi:DnaJ domain